MGTDAYVNVFDVFDSFDIAILNQIIEPGKRR